MCVYVCELFTTVNDGYRAGMENVAVILSNQAKEGQWM